ncbi:hypothetical protein BU25DRAFT_163068 [Macroventuria anomochaeta]|uniref:Uncharacterized protein n=1 Tax=Macroventuria anomochaeta TaxID=301207 RepID=A0ACB6RSD8_9PLEO|nr:uncharacterized protein BU25DRAFT_163068 [Macroventuria anomochaeta]KAF2624192.1 hypothetical protein BU25DRAFT_163068 [Macroventuria anomochaeta]
MRPSKSKTEPKGSPPARGPIERFGETNGPAVLLLVGRGGGSHQFLISESSLCTLGPRWKGLLSNRSITKSKRLFSKSPKIINLQGEHPNAIRVILHIATLQFTKVPTTLDFPEIVHLAEAVARYDAHSLLVNYIDTWLAPYRERLLHPGYEEWLFIAHQFGYETEYLELSKHLAIHCRVDPTGKQLLAPETPFVLEGKFPIDTLEHIKEGRKQILCTMLKVTYDLWASLSQGSNCKIGREDEPNVRRRCAAVNLLELTDYLRALGLFPMLKTVETFQWSPYDLSTMLADAKALIPIAATLLISRRGSAPVESPRHGQCHIGSQLAAIPARILNDVAWPVGIPTLLHIKDNGGEYRLDYAYANPCADVDGLAVQPMEFV